MFRSLPALVLAFYCVTAPAQSPDNEFARALELHQQANLPAALAAYSKILERQPANPIVLSNMGAIHARLGNYAEAIRYYLRALESDPDNPGIRFNLGIAYSQSGQVGLAAGQLTRVVSLDPQNRNAVLLLADAWLRAGENQRAIEVLEPRAQQFGDDRAYAYVLGTALVRDGQLEKGQPLIDRIFRDGDSAEAQLLLGTAHVLGRDYPAAIKAFERSIQLNPKLPAAHAFYGRTLLMMGNTHKAAEAFRAELALNANDYESHLQMGILLKQDQEYDAALTHIQRALELRPSSPDAQYQLGSTYVAQGKAEQAVQVLTSLTEQRPEMAQAHVSLATAYYRLKRRADGDRHRGIAEKLNADRSQGLTPEQVNNPSPPPARETAARVKSFEELAQEAEAARVAEHTESATRLYHDALRIRPDWDEGWWYAGTLHFGLNQFAEAENAFAKLTALKPEAGAAHALRGLSLFRLTKYDGALESLKRAAVAGLPADNAELKHAARYHLAILLTQSGDPETALKLLYTIAREGDHSPGVERAMGVAALRLRALPAEITPARQSLVELAGRAHMIAASRDNASAVDYFQRLAKEYPDEPGVHYTCGVFFLRDDPDRALEHFQRELLISPGHALAQLQIAFELIRRNDFAAALPHAQQAVKLAPESFAAHNALGRVFLETGKTQSAVRELELAVKLEPASAESYFSLARAYTKAGLKAKADQARTEFNRLEKLRQQGSL
jgi:tetratricopeptide (TPR) repeat protein